MFFTWLTIPTIIEIIIMTICLINNLLYCCFESGSREWFGDALFSGRGLGLFSLVRIFMTVW